jgi:predicted permease
MQIILTVIVPIFAVIAVGFLAARLKLLDDAVGEGLAKFVFVIAVPALLFRTLATANFAGANPLFLWFAYFLAVALTWAPATILVRRLIGTDRRTGIIAGISASFANTVFVAIPAVQRAYGDEGLEALFLIIAIHMPVMMTVATLLMERAARLDALENGTAPPTVSALTTVKRIAVNLSRNAIIVGILCGLVWRLTGLELPGPVEDVVRLLGSTAGPVSLFAMGMSLTRYGLRGDLSSALVVSALSLVLMPAIVYVVGVELLPPLWLKVAVLTAACPAGVNCYLFASYFKSGEKLAATAILVSTLLSVVTLAVWLAILA